jgi:outer membrane protein TolC
VAIIKRDTGVEPPNTVLQAEAEVANRQANVIDSVRIIADAQDALKRAMNIKNGGDMWEYNLIPLDKPFFTPVNPNEEACYAEALQLRPDYAAAKLGKDIAEINKIVAWNQRLPQLDLVAQYQLSGGEQTVGNSFENAETGDFETYNAGVRFSYPLQNRTARAQYRQSVSQFQQREEVIRNLQELIRLDLQPGESVGPLDVRCLCLFFRPVAQVEKLGGSNGQPVPACLPGHAGNRDLARRRYAAH